MYIRNIELKDYRNYRDIELQFSPGVNLFIGNNAQGKTNLLESIYMNSMARSFKNCRDRELIRFGQEFCRIRSVIVTSDGEEETEILIKKDGGKSVKIDGVRARRTSELLERVYVIIFSPEDLKIVKEDPEKRRRFIDRELCQISPGYFSDLNSYRRALLQRNSLLKERNVEETMLEVWDRELARYGTRIIAARREFIGKIDGISCDIHSLISGGREELKLKYEMNVPLPEGSEDAEELYRHTLEESRENDLAARTTSRGPHRDDLRILADGIDLRKFGSQGQQRTAALSLKLSEIRIIEEETGERPILLLDDVLSELDNDRQTYLMNSLGENQMFITTTDLVGKVARSIPRGKVFRIRNGEVDIEI